MAKKSGISIDPKNRGKFTEACKRWGFKGVTSQCISKAKKSKNPLTRKRATFAESARKWSR